MIIRLSQKLHSKLKPGPLETLALQENPLLDWSAHLFLVEGKQYILVSNTASLYSFVMIGKGVAIGKDPRDGIFYCIERILNEMLSYLKRDGLGKVYTNWIKPDVTQSGIRFARALNRSVTGSMNDLILGANYILTDGETAVKNVGFQLNDTLLSTLGFDTEKYGRPNGVFRRLVKNLK